MKSVALDEAHEMLINRETKACLTRITPNTLSKLAGYLPYRSCLLANIKKQIIPCRTNEYESATYMSSCLFEKETENVKAYLNVFQQHKVFDCEPSNGDGVTVVKPPKHFVSGETADTRLREDMLSSRQIILTSYKNYVDYQFLSTRSTSVVRRRKKKL